MAASNDHGKIGRTLTRTRSVRTLLGTWLRTLVLLLTRCDYLKLLDRQSFHVDVVFVALFEDSCVLARLANLSVVPLGCQIIDADV